MYAVVVYIQTVNHGFFVEVMKYLNFVALKVWLTRFFDVLVWCADSL